MVARAGHLERVELEHAQPVDHGQTLSGRAGSERGGARLARDEECGAPASAAYWMTARGGHKRQSNLPKSRLPILELANGHPT